jgi:hypothetical protein
MAVEEPASRSLVPQPFEQTIALVDFASPGVRPVL